MPETAHPTMNQNGTSDNAISAFDDVATTLADLIKGYEEMIDRAENDLKPIVQRLLAMHKSHAAEIHEELQRLGGHPDGSGSAMGLVHSAVATVRDWFDGLNASAIEPIANGEDQIIKTYDEAIERAQGEQQAVQLLVRQRDDVKAQVQALRS